MSYVIAGLGNPGEKYEKTRHNTGRMAVEYFVKEQKQFSNWMPDKKTQCLKSEGKIGKPLDKVRGKQKIICLLPETFMNKSGNALKKIITSKKKAERLIVVHDDLDLPLGKFKISFGKSAGGHKGVQSVIRAVKTKDFIRVRIGISPKKKPDQKKIMDFIVAKFKSSEEKIIKSTFKKTSEVLASIITEGLSKTMSLYN